MVKIVSIGVLSIQGDISEHESILNQTFKDMNTSGEVILIKNSSELNKIQGLIIPGGESTTISKNIVKEKIYDRIKKRVLTDSLPIMGTCAGCVLLAKKIADNNDIKTLNLIDMEVKRNAFGRQRDSFESDLKIDGLKDSFHAVFIRAPIITKVWGDCKILSTFSNKIVAVQQNNFLALSFHPELTNDTRIHRYFLSMII